MFIFKIWLGVLKPALSVLQFGLKIATQKKKRVLIVCLKKALKKPPKWQSTGFNIEDKKVTYYKTWVYTITYSMIMIHFKVRKSQNKLQILTSSWRIFPLFTTKSYQLLKSRSVNLSKNQGVVKNMESLPKFYDLLLLPLDSGNLIINKSRESQQGKPFLNFGACI